MSTTYRACMLATQLTHNLYNQVLTFAHTHTLFIINSFRALKDAIQILTLTDTTRIYILQFACLLKALHKRVTPNYTSCTANVRLVHIFSVDDKICIIVGLYD
jgi:hypothetical protein